MHIFQAFFPAVNTCTFMPVVHHHHPLPPATPTRSPKSEPGVIFIGGWGGAWGIPDIPHSWENGSHHPGTWRVFGCPGGRRYAGVDPTHNLSDRRLATPLGFPEKQIINKQGSESTSQMLTDRQKAICP